MTDPRAPVTGVVTASTAPERPDVIPESGDGWSSVAAWACVAGSDRSKHIPPPAIADLATRSATRRVFGFDIDNSPSGGRGRASCSPTTVQAYGLGYYMSPNIFRALLVLVVFVVLVVLVVFVVFAVFVV
jgi:hypothetical protein